MDAEVVTPDELRSEGYYIYFRHYRVPEGKRNRDSRHCKHLYRYMSGDAPCRPNPLGGKTVCVILDQNRRFVCEGVTFCRSNENFVKKLGRQYAFDHAMQAWPS